MQHGGFYSHIPATLENQMTATLHQENGSVHPIGMVVDDDELVRESVAAILEDLCDHVYQASDGQEGLEVLADHPDISLIVTDIAMPRLDGVAFVGRARRLHPALKVLFLSGLQRPPATEEFLPKPFMRRALVSAVQHLLTDS
jgi:two-component system cell cycle sensor histidine kinase/response regulator CckA